MITDYMAQYILKYLRDGDAHKGGFCNFFDAGYYDNGSWVSMLFQKERIDTARFDDASNPTELICEGRIMPGNLNTTISYSDRDLLIKVLETEDDDSCIAQITMNSNVQSYFQTGDLSTTIEIALQWIISFEQEEEQV